MISNSKTDEYDVNLPTKRRRVDICLMPIESATVNIVDNLTKVMNESSELSKTHVYSRFVSCSIESFTMMC